MNICIIMDIQDELNAVKLTRDDFGYSNSN